MKCRRLKVSDQWGLCAANLWPSSTGKVCHGKTFREFHISIDFLLFPFESWSTHQLHRWTQWSQCYRLPHPWLILLMLQLYNSPQQVFKHIIFVIGNLDDPQLTYFHSGPFFNMLEFVGNVLNPSVQPYLFSPYIGKWYFKCLPVFQSFQSHWICTRDS